MKKILLLLIVLIPLCIVAAPKDNAEKKEPAVTLDAKSHGFGTIRENGGPVSCEFKITNTGTAPLVIISATAQCGCTRPSFTTEPIKPGKSGKIRVTYLPKGRPGEFSKNVRVRTNAPKSKKITLRIAGTVLP